MSKISAKINLLQAFEGSTTTLDEAFKASIMTAKNGNQYVPLDVIKGKKWVCIDDLSGDHLYKKANGDVQLQVDIKQKRDVDKFGNTHSISLTQSKSVRENGGVIKYCGDGKEFAFTKSASPVVEKSPEILLQEASSIDFEDEPVLDF